MKKVYLSGISMIICLCMLGESGQRDEDFDWMRKNRLKIRLNRRKMN